MSLISKLSIAVALVAMFASSANAGGADTTLVCHSSSSNCFGPGF